MNPAIHRTAGPPGPLPALRDQRGSAGARRPGTSLTLRYQINDHRNPCINYLPMSGVLGTSLWKQDEGYLH